MRIHRSSSSPTQRPGARVNAELLGWLPRTRHSTSSAAHHATRQRSKNGRFVHALCHRLVQGDVPEGCFGKRLRKFLKHAFRQRSATDTTSESNAFTRTLCRTVGDHGVDVTNAQRLTGLRSKSTNCTTGNTSRSGQG